MQPANTTQLPRTPRRDGWTLARRERFLERWPMIAPLGYDEEFKRKWVYYLSYCEAGFTEGSIDVGIYQYRKPA